MAALPANHLPRLARAPLLALALAAGACSTPTVLTPGEGGAAVDTGLGGLFMPFMGQRNVVGSDSLTVQRVRGANPTVEPLVPEAGNVWPVAEGPRPSLLGNPEEAMRNIPSYSPELIQGSPPARSPVATPGVPRGSSSPPPGALSGLPAQSQVPGLPPGDMSPPGARSEGRVMTSPSGRMVTGTGSAGRVTGFTSPTGGGAVIRDGNVETWIGPDGRTSTRIVPP
jgi:hypothetical protein